MELPAGLIIRPELGSDYSKITRITDIAFGHSGEGKLIEALRMNPLYIKGLSLVAIINAQVVGHILFFPVLIRSDNKVFRSLALAPMSVLPGFQGRGIGSALISAGLDEAKAGKFDSVLVLGPGDYYLRFGFKPASRFGIESPFEGSDDMFFALELRSDGLSGVSGVVDYPGEFAPGLAKTAG